MHQIAIIKSLLVDRPEFLQTPEMGGIVLEVLHLHSNHGPWRWTLVVVVRVPDRKQVGGKGRVEGLGQQDKLEGHLLLQLH